MAGIKRINIRKKVLSIVELDDNVFKLLQGRPSRRGWSIDKFAVKDISGKSDDDKSKIIKETFQELNIKEKKVILLIPRNLVTVRYLQLPSSAPDELQGMIDMQIVRLIPYTKEEMVYDYFVTGINKEGYTRVFLVIIHRDVVSRHLDIFKKAGIDITAIELDALALVDLYQFIQTKETRLTGPAQALALLDVDSTATNIVIIQGGMPVLTRAVAIGSGHLTGAVRHQPERDSAVEWTEELKRSLALFQKEHAQEVGKVIILGGPKDLCAGIVKDKLGLDAETVDVISYLEGAAWPEKELAGRESKMTVPTAGLLGAVRGKIAASVNLVPEEMVRARAGKQKRKSLAVALILSVGILGMLGLTFNKKIEDRRAYLSLLNQRLEQTNPLASELSIKKERLALIKRQLSIENSCLDILRELYSIIPVKTALNVFIYDDTQGVTIKGSSPAMSEVFDLIPKLENSAYFENVTSRYATQRRIRGQEITEFHIECIMEGQEVS